LAAAGLPVSPFPLPPTHFAMTLIRDFIGTLTVAGKSFKEIKENVKKVNCNKTLKKTQIYDIMKKVKAGKQVMGQRSFNTKRQIINLAFFVNFITKVELQERHCQETHEGPWLVD
jgi:hypothetical protein